jgi:hypothetical protein
MFEKGTYGTQYKSGMTITSSVKSHKEYEEAFDLIV